MHLLFEQPLFLLALCIILGQIMGNWGYKHFKLGSSATLFVGLAFSYLAGANQVILAEIPKVIFTASLIGFIVAVGLKASKNIKTVIANYGLKFMALALTITAVGALSTTMMIHLFPLIKYQVIGTYVGALTSSPGLATALELSKNVTTDPSALVGLGYAIAYVPGVLLVIGFAQWLAKGRHTAPVVTKSPVQAVAVKSFSIVKFFIVISCGLALGSLKLDVGLASSFSLELTGGVLMSALFFGSSVKGFVFSDQVLGVIKEMALNIFLATVGLKYGFVAVSAIQSAGAIILLIGLMTGVLSIASGYILGKYLLKIENEVLIGGICGGMTSTPGLAAAIEAFDSDDVVVGYGATYPFALMAMIIFTNILF